MDINDLILEDHAEQRRLFAQLEEIGAERPDALARVWERLRALLDAHAEAEERFFYPTVLKRGRGGNDAPDAAEETEDAIEDHNDIRDTAGKVGEHEVGSKAWFKAVGACNVANSKHMAEEERQGMTDMREQVSREQRHQLAVDFAAFRAAHLTGVRPVDKDPKAYVRDPQKALASD